MEFHLDIITFLTVKHTKARIRHLMDETKYIINVNIVLYNKKIKIKYK